MSSKYRVTYVVTIEADSKEEAGRLADELLYWSPELAERFDTESVWEM